MKVPFLTKTCERCEETFEIPHVARKRTRELTIQFAACPHCLYFREIEPLTSKRRHKATVGRCRTCSVPFTIIDHHALGFCKRDYMAYLRHKGEAV